jgi:hypothetical protein
VDVKNLDNLIKAKLLSKFASIDYDDLLFRGVESLEESHRMLVKLNIEDGKKKRTVN